ncbi:formate/nitrite transporter family protein [uncultured Clostridium sp.]|uniref:formate/nitrite transporter family protein n=1 Tax=uncultured Clostridium sp. TaxID=59620 RepID=UPI0025DEF677|nr:formate/nitrite transporter family protein [uncultured Clostridium sp.]
MYSSDIDVITKMAEKKAKNANQRTGKYLGRAVVTGFYIMVAIILSYTMGAILYPKYPEVSKVLIAATFCFAIATVVFFSGELFTGNNFVMTVGMFKGKVDISSTLKVWLYSFIGNAIGLMIFGYLFVKSGASFNAIQHYIEGVAYAKLEMPAYQMLLRGILCNLIVCLAYLSGIKMKSESGKLIMMFFSVFAFIIAGFEHSIANIGIFSIAYFALGGLPMALVLKNLLFVVIGNIIGGGLILGGSMVYISVDEEY